MTSFGQALTVYVNPYQTCGTGYGSASVNAIYGTPPYNYLWSTIPPQTTNFVSGLTAGSYSVTVTDSLLNTAIANFTIQDVPGITCSICNIQNDTNGLGIGSMSACPIGGTSPYNYYWNIPGNYQFTQTATHLYAGTYCLTISDSYACICTDCATVINNITGINELNKSNIVQILPNPTLGIFTIDLHNLKENDLSIELFDAVGQIVYKEKMANSLNHNIDISKLPTGIYYLRIFNRQIILNKKVLKE
jgi:hypothetical protein